MRFLDRSGASDIEDAVRKTVNELRAAASATGPCAGISAPPYDPAAFAFHLGVTRVRAADLGYAGHATYADEGLTIEYDKYSGHRARHRFTIAHEVGHIILAQVSGDARKLGYRSPKSEVERLCNKLAAEILTPAAEIMALWKSGRSQPGWHRPNFVIQVATAYSVSLEMAALRIVELCDPAMGVILLDDSTRTWNWAHGAFPRVAVNAALLAMFAEGTRRAADPPETTGHATINVSLRQSMKMVPISWTQLASKLCLITLQY